MLLARLMWEFENERLRGDGLNTAETHKVEAIMVNLIGAATEDLMAAVDLLDRWGLIPESSLYKNTIWSPRRWALEPGIFWLAILARLPADCRVLGDLSQKTICFFVSICSPKAESRGFTLNTENCSSAMVGLLWASGWSLRLEPVCLLS
jgi:hypothetical protein